MEHYTCPRELMPVVESALAAEGFVVETPLERAGGGVRITVMTRGGAVIALHEDVARDMADIIVYRDDEAGRLMVLDELPRLAASPDSKVARPAWWRRAPARRRWGT